jgi:hypothetical protein
LLITIEEFLMTQPDPRADLDIPEEEFRSEDLISYDEVDMPAEDWEGYEVEILNALLE